MFIDAVSKYTNSDLNYENENTKAIERFIQKAVKITNYSDTKMISNTSLSSSTDYTYMSKKIKPTPEKLKKAMFKASSRGIATVLQKK